MPDALAGPCVRCLRNSTALALVGHHLEKGGLRARPVGILSFSADQLIEEIGGRRKGELHLGLEKALLASRVDSDSDSRFASACRHQGAFEWPACLLEDPEPPWVLTVSGDSKLIAGTPPGRAVALVGARKANAYGRSTARMLAHSAAGAGCVVVSGLAFGIDTEAHKGSLSFGSGRTVAVVGGGVDHVYPRSNARLFEEISAAGCIVSEMPCGTGVWRWSFPARNRLIAALSQMTVVVQAARLSGSLHTAEAALLRGRTVAAVPGPINDPVSAGSNALIADGALAVISTESLAEALGFDQPLQSVTPPAELVGAWRLVTNGGLTEALSSGGPRSAEVMSDLTRLELLGMIQRLPGGGWVPIGHGGGSVGSTP